MTSRKILLDNLLFALVQEWGRKEVAVALEHVPDSAEKTNARGIQNDNSLGKQGARRKTKLLASEQVARARLPDAQAAPLQELAARFDLKQFLPTVSDVREFLVMMGETPGAMKDRSDAFRRLLNALSGLPRERLEQIANSASHSGPSQLGPLSDAISAAAATLPRQREPSTS